MAVRKPKNLRNISARKLFDKEPLLGRILNELEHLSQTAEPNFYSIEEKLLDLRQQALGQGSARNLSGE